MISTLDKLYAVLRRDLLTAIRHRSGFVVTMVGVLTELAAFYFLSRAIGPGFRPDGLDYFPFLLVGTGVYTFFVMSAQAFLNAVQEAQQTGTLEVLMTTSTPPAELIVLSSVSAFAGNLLNLIVYLVAGVAVFRASIHVNFLSLLVAVVLCLAIALALGIAAATLQVAFQKGSALVWLLGSGAWFLSGTMFSIHSLPAPFRVCRPRFSSHLRRRQHTSRTSTRSVGLTHGPYTRRPGRVRCCVVAACLVRIVIQSAMRAAEWNSLILLRMLIRLPPKVPD